MSGSRNFWSECKKWFSPSLRPKLYQLPRNFLNPQLAMILVLGTTVLGTLGFMFIEHYTLLQAFYMTVITLSTVGYHEVKPLSSSGQLFTSLLIIVNTGIFAYVLAVFSYYVVSGEFFKKMHFTMIEKKIAQLENHVIICGYGRYGKEISSHFFHHKIPFVIVEHDPRVIEEIQKSEEKILYIQDDTTNDETLQAAGIKKAKALIAALPDDSENLFIVLTARQLNSKANIISRATHYRSHRKLKLAGANHIIMPEQIGGFYMATLVNKPGATEFFSYITREMESDIEFEEIKYENMPKACRGQAIRDLHIRRETGANIIAYKPPEGTYIVNPVPDTVLKENSSFIVIGSREQLNALKEFLNKMH